MILSLSRDDLLFTNKLKNAKEAIRLYKKGAKLGDLVCKYHLFLFYSNNGFNEAIENARHIYVKDNPITALKYLKELVRSDPETVTNDILKKISPKLCDNCYDTKELITQTKKQYEEIKVESYYWFAKVLEFGHFNHKRNLTKAMKYYTKAADAGYIRANKRLKEAKQRRKRLS